MGAWAGVCVDGPDLGGCLGMVAVVADDAAVGHHRVALRYGVRHGFASKFSELIDKQ